MSADLDKLTDYYVQEIIGQAQRYMDRDEMLLRRVIRQLIDQYATRREAEDKARHA